MAIVTATIFSVFDEPLLLSLGFDVVDVDEVLPPPATASLTFGNINLYGGIESLATQKGE